MIPKKLYYPSKNRFYTTTQHNKKKTTHKNFINILIFEYIYYNTQGIELFIKNNYSGIYTEFIELFWNKPLFYNTLKQENKVSHQSTIQMINKYLLFNEEILIYKK